jgi:type II secretory pathway component GspD/PulD (secretin)
MKKNRRPALISLLFAILFLLVIRPATAAETVDKMIHEDDDPKIAFNFIDVEIPAIIKFISNITGDNFIFDEKIKGKITIIAPTKLTLDESFTLFTSILNLKGFTIIPAGTKTYKVIPSAQAKQSGEISTGEDMPVNEGYITKILSLEHIKADEAMKFLRPVVSRNGHLSIFGPRNLLMIVDSAINIEKITSILKRIDQPPTHEEGSRINVYFVEHADATELATVLDGIIKSTRTTKQTSAKNKDTPMIDSVSRVSITPDKATNSLIIVAPPSDYKNILAVIKALDKRRKQVYVEAMIVEASIDKLRDIGTKWRAAVSHNDEPVLVGGLGTVNSSTISSIISGLAGFSAGGMGNFMTIPGSVAGSTSDITIPGFAAILSLSEFESAINILSTPQLLTSDNEEAEIHVGENVPFISSRESYVETSNVYSTNIERKDVGISLKITPQITEGDYVKLDIYQEISSVKDTSESILTTVGPTTTTRSTKTSVAVKDAQTVVISGLMQETEEEGLGKIPLLGDIPLLGWFFKYENSTKTKKNLFLFLTPHIITDASQLAAITDAKHRDFSMNEKLYEKSELLVRFNKDVSGEKAEEIISANGASVIKFIEPLNLYLIRLKKKQDVEEAMALFASLPEVLYAEPNYKVKLQNSLPERRKNLPDSETPSGEKEGSVESFSPYHNAMNGLNRR